MRRLLVALVAAACTAAVIAAPAKIKPAPPQKWDRTKVAIPHTKYTLDNGLTLVIHEDHSVPIVSVLLWYGVGSRDETRGKTGFAHLFEHLFSDGSEHYPHGFREAMDDLGATNRNGFTDTDRTLFFEDVPASALDRTLYLEADRMGFLEKQISKELLDRERGVVQNEKRQNEGEPYGKVETQIVETIYPSSHPYSWDTMGSMQDLDAASLEDVRAWYRTYYGPNNCVLSLAGDVTPEHALELVKKYFGGIAPGPPLRRIKEWVPRLDRNIRDEGQERVPQARVYRIYPAPGWRSGDVPLLKIVASVLSGSNSARLDRRLVFDKKLVTEVTAKLDVSELASEFSVVATLTEGVEPAIVEHEIDVIIHDFLADGPTAEELERAKMRELAGFVRDNERLQNRAGVFAESISYAGRPDAYLDRLETEAKATTADVKNVARKWLDASHYTLIVRPYPQLAAAKETFERSVLPPLGAEATDVGFPAPQTTTLANGLKVMVLERHNVPMVRFALVVGAGYAADPEKKRGLAAIALALLKKGTSSRNAFQIADELDTAGARVGAYNTIDVSVVFLQALSANLAPALDIYSDIVLHPAFTGEMLEVTRREYLPDIAQDNANPGYAGMSFVRRLLYGEAHAYGGPLSGLGSESTVGAINREDLLAWRHDWFHPNNSTLIISGDTTMRQIVPQVERIFGQWQPGATPKKNLTPVPHTAKRTIYLVDQPGWQQSAIVGAEVSEPGGQAEDMAIATVMKDFGGMATSRLNRNLRADKHWSYTAWATLLPGRGQRTLLVKTMVQADKTKGALFELTKEVRGIAGETPIAGDEFASIMRTEALGLPGRFATLTSIENAGIDMLTYGYPPDYYSKYAQNVHALTAADLASAAKKYIHPDEMVWIVAGDLSKIERGIRELALGDVVLVNADGQPIK